jgi:hypothetical protein
MSAGPVLWSSGAAGGVRLTLRGHGSAIEFWGREGWARSRPTSRLIAALFEALRATGVHPLHASAGVPPGRVGCVAFVGRRRTGKSMTLVHAGAAGWRLLGEDLVWLDLASLVLYGDDRGVHLRPGALSLIDAKAQASSAASRGGRKRYVTFTGLGTGHVPRAPLRCVVELRRNRVKARCDRLPRLEGARLLWRATGIPLSVPARLEFAREVPRVLDSVPAFRLSFSDGPPPFGLLEEAMGEGEVEVQE